jgi:diguanylate cyclase (GGDEF)-like protein
LRFRDRCLGVIELINCIGPEGFSKRNLLLLEALADFAAIALENARHVQRIYELTITDDCTGLYNARHLNFILETELSRSQRYNYEFALVFIDLEGLQNVADSFGPLRRSKLLAEIGQLIKANCRLIDFAFRYGDNEFVMLLPQTSKENGILVAKLLHKSIRETTWLASEGLNVRITASIGVAAFPGDSTTKIGLLEVADEAMYQVKSTTRDGVGAANIRRIV